MVASTIFVLARQTKIDYEANARRTAVKTDTIYLLNYSLARRIGNPRVRRGCWAIAHFPVDAGDASLDCVAHPFKNRTAPLFCTERIYKIGDNVSYADFGGPSVESIYRFLTHTVCIMADQPRVIISGFADETAQDKKAEQQFAAFAALGLQYYTIRFIDAGEGVKNVMKLTTTEIQRIRQLQNDYGLNVSSIGSPIGKVKLEDVDDGTSNEFIPFDKYLEKDVARACELAHAFETKLIRGFSFYHPRGEDPKAHLSKTVDQLGQIAEKCHRSDLTFGLEVEANLVGQTGDTLAEIYRQVNHPAMVLIFDGANIVMQGYSTDEVVAQYKLMKDGLGWIHIKDYLRPENQEKGGHVDENAMAGFVPSDQGDSGHEAIFRDLKSVLPAMEEKLKRRGIPGVFVDLEPHLKGGGQFGGYSGPDGMGVALRALRNVLDYTGIGYYLRDFDDIRADRGF